MENAIVLRRTHERIDINMQNKVLNLYPIDYPFETLVNRVEGGKLKLNPDFQRKYKWNKENEKKTSRFIESILMRIPLPACYFAEDEEKKHIVIDGVLQWLGCQDNKNQKDNVPDIAYQNINFLRTKN